jgi:two-component system, OmpR family, sensor histidine kinase ResE
VGEGHIDAFKKAIRWRMLGWLILIFVILFSGQWFFHVVLGLNIIISSIIAAILSLIISVLYAFIVSAQIIKPTAYLAQAIQHIAPNEHVMPAPNIEELKLGHQLVESLTRQVYAYASSADASGPTKATTNTIPSSLLDQLPVAVIGLNKEGVLVLTNKALRTLLQTEQAIGLKLEQVLEYSVEDGQSLQSWLDEVKTQSITSTHQWQKVEVKTINHVRLGYFDIAVSFNKNSASDIEVLITMYDHSDAYSSEMDSVSFIAMAVHEMRTPVTVMRGYIEAFEDELGTNATPQLVDDIHKMNASAETLSSFVSNILNVARINEGQLSLNLREENWNQVLPKVVDALRNRAAVYGKQIELRMEPGMPTIAADQMTVGEVVINLVENAIKYSPDTSGIRIISRVNQEGLIETTVEDQGVGIPETVMPHLFQKFYRNHRNRAQIGGTGLGLYLSKTIINAHQGNIWVHSKEGEGSTFGFTLLPFSRLASELQSNDNSNITRGTHGWIKNHSLQRR